MKEVVMTKFLILIMSFFVSGCAYQASAPRVISENIIPKENEEEHELIIMDSGFESWFLTYAKPLGYHTLSFYETRNAQYVSAWNQKARSPFGPISNTIDYDVHEQYGMEVNHKLYWYFQYIESIYGRRFLLG